MNPTVIEILTEETSMEEFLKELLPRILPDDYALDVNCFIRPHEGKSDLQKSLPKKFRAYPDFGYPVKVLIIHDQDSNDCVQLKNDIVQVIASTNSNIPYITRIACRELENWYLGDQESLKSVLPDIKKKWKNPDNVFGSNELNSNSTKFTKTYTAREMGKIIKIVGNESPSFNQFLIGLEKLIQQ